MTESVLEYDLICFYLHLGLYPFKEINYYQYCFMFTSAIIGGNGKMPPLWFGLAIIYSF